jgi:hypothetical protein
VSVTGVPADIDLHKFRTAIATFATRQEAESFAAGILVSSQVGDKKRVADLSVSGDETNGFAVLANFSPFGLSIVVR